MQSKLSRFLILALCLGIVAFAVAACGGATGETTTSAAASASSDTTSAPTETSAAPTDTNAASTETTTAAAVPKPDKPIKIAVFTYNASPMPAAVFAAVQEEAAKIGSVEPVLFQGTGDGKQQETAILDAVQTGEYAGFVVQANDGLRLQPAVVEAQKKGIVTVVLDSTLDEPRKGVALEARPGVTTTIGNAYEEWCQQWADAIVAALKAKNGSATGTVAIMPGQTNFPPDAIRVQLTREKLAAASKDINVIVAPEGGYNTSSAQRAALDFLQSQKKVDVFAVIADQMSQGVQVALEQQNLVPGKDVYIVSQGATVEAVEMIKAGKWWGSLRNYPRYEGATAVDIICKALAGQQVPETINNFDVPPAMVDKESLAEYPGFVPEWSTSGS